MMDVITYASKPQRLHNTSSMDMGEDGWVYLVLLAMFQTALFTPDRSSSSAKVVVVSAIMIYSYGNTNPS